MRKKPGCLKMFQVIIIDAILENKNQLRIFFSMKTVIRISRKTGRPVSVASLQKPFI